MKKLLKALLALTICASLAYTVYAGTVGERVVKAITVGTGHGTWTNTYQYAALDLKRLSIEKSLVATNYVDLTRIWTSGSVTYTNSMCRITVAASKGTIATNRFAMIQYGDKIFFDSAIPTGSTAVVEFEVQKH